MSAPYGLVASWADKSDKSGMPNYDTGLVCGCHDYEFDSKDSRDAHVRSMRPAGTSSSSVHHIHEYTIPVEWVYFAPEESKNADQTPRSCHVSKLRCHCGAETSR